MPLATPFHFRLLTDGLVGYMWPKWTRGGGEESEFRVHCAAAEVDEQYRLDLYRYGLEKEHVKCIGWFGEHGPGATMQVTPDGDYTRTGVAFNRQGFSNNPHHRQTVEAPARSGLYYMHAESLSGKFFTFPWIIAPAKDAAERPPVAVLLANMNWNAYNNWVRHSLLLASGLHSPRSASNDRANRAADPTISTRWSCRRGRAPTAASTWTATPRWTPTCTSTPRSTRRSPSNARSRSTTSPRTRR